MAGSWSRCPGRRARCGRCGSNEVLPRLRERGLGATVAVRTFRLAGIGESQVAEVLGEEMLRRPDPEVATYARLEAVDVRVSASVTVAGSAAEAVEAAAAVVRERLGDHVWAEGDTTWATAIGERLGQRVGGSRSRRSGPAASSRRSSATSSGSPWPRGRPRRLQRSRGRRGWRRSARADGGPLDAGIEVGLAVRARPRGSELAVSIAIVTPNGEQRQTRATYTGDHGSNQSALLACRGR